MKLKKPVCPYCNKDRIVFIKGNEPWDCDHYACPKCDSTFITLKAVEWYRKAIKNEIRKSKRKKKVP